MNCNEFQKLEDNYLLAETEENHETIIASCGILRSHMESQLYNIPIQIFRDKNNKIGKVNYYAAGT
jgi:hypothetical protein